MLSKAAMIPVVVFACMAVACMIFICWWFPLAWKHGLRKDEEEYAAQLADSGLSDRAAWRRQLLANTPLGEELANNPNYIIGGKQNAQITTNNAQEAATASTEPPKVVAQEDAAPTTQHEDL